MRLVFSCAVASFAAIAVAQPPTCPSRADDILRVQQNVGDGCGLQGIVDLLTLDDEQLKLSEVCRKGLDCLGQENKRCASSAADFGVWLTKWGKDCTSAAECRHSEYDERPGLVDSLDCWNVADQTGITRRCALPKASQGSGDLCLYDDECQSRRCSGGSCAAPTLKPGDTCSSEFKQCAPLPGTSAPDALTDAFELCIQDGMCPNLVAQADRPCSRKYDKCDVTKDLYCRSTDGSENDGTCQPLPKRGEACAFTNEVVLGVNSAATCAAGSFCSPDTRTCVAPVADGQQCGGSLPCANARSKCINATVTAGSASTLVCRAPLSLPNDATFYTVGDSDAHQGFWCESGVAAAVSGSDNEQYQCLARLEEGGCDPEDGTVVPTLGHKCMCTLKANPKGVWVPIKTYRVPTGAQYLYCGPTEACMETADPFERFEEFDEQDERDRLRRKRRLARTISEDTYCTQLVNQRAKQRGKPDFLRLQDLQQLALSQGAVDALARPGDGSPDTDLYAPEPNDATSLARCRATLASYFAYISPKGVSPQRPATPKPAGLKGSGPWLAMALGAIALVVLGAGVYCWRKRSSGSSGRGARTLDAEAAYVGKHGGGYEAFTD